jgi:hypothetical protein
MDSNAFDFDLAKSVDEYYQLTEQELDSILNEVWIANPNQRGIYHPSK